jgi:hydroxyethylthiazole kinase-like uncharacterized protein yjeF
VIRAQILKTLAEAKPDQVLTVAEMRMAEQAAIEAGSSVSELMERAGRGAAQWVRRVAMGRPVTVLCGPGNNGGDGYVIARALCEAGLPVRVIAPLPPRTEAAIAAQQAWSLMGSSVKQSPGAVLVDALFGSGLARPLDDDVLGTLREAAHASSYSIAVDVPSGIEADGGAALNEFLPFYDLTLALGAWKRAHWTMPAMEAMGERRLVPIGIPRVMGASRLAGRPRLDPPFANAHKYSRGVVGVVGGVMPGAGQLATEAAMHGGAGYVKLFADAWPPQPGPELVIEGGEITGAIADKRLNALVVGPGLGRGDLARERLGAVLARELPTVVDGDALHLLDPALLSGRRAGLVLTPHAGELAALYQALEIEAADPVERLVALAHDTRAVVVAKGPDTRIVGPEGEVVFTAGATPWLSVAGTGDVLAGLVASRIAAGRTLIAAAEEAVWLHARAGALAGAVFTPRALIAALPQAFEECL